MSDWGSILGFFMRRLLGVAAEPGVVFVERTRLAEGVTGTLPTPVELPLK
jgi:hypothetical protein